MESWEKFMKICLVTRFFNLRNGGIGRFSMELLEALKKKGVEVVPISTSRKGTSGHVVYSFVDLALKLPRNCDVYHCLTPMEAIYVPKNVSVVTFHDFIPWKHVNEIDTHYVRGSTRLFQGLMSKSIFALSAKIAARCSLIVCNSEQTKKEVIEYLNVDESKVSVIRFGIDRSLKPAVHEHKKYRIGILCFLDQRKRIDLLIKSFQNADIDAELVIGGTGADYPRLKRLAGDDARIQFAGFVPDEKLNDYYNSLDLFVFPSKIEGYGLPIVEALACKKPVVVLRDAIIPNDVKANCTVVDNLTDFFKNPKPTANIEAAYNFSRLHDWDKCVEDYIACYKRLS
jgi:glycosyltransferase involved in cell wall biosynthesis